MILLVYLKHLSRHIKLYMCIHRYDLYCAIVQCLINIRFSVSSNIYRFIMVNALKPLLLDFELCKLFYL